MPDSGRPSDTTDADDLAALPTELSSESLSRSAIILPFDAAVAAVRHFEKQRRGVVNWEGWVRMRDGARAKSLAHTGSFALPREAARAATVTIEGMTRARERWERNPEYPGAQLYFGLSFGSPTAT